MRLYLAAVHSNDNAKGGSCYNRLTPQEQVYADQIPYYLESYHYVKRQKYVDAIRSAGHKVFLDSGAFSAYTLGQVIDIREYCSYIKRNQDIIDTVDGVLIASVLDAIGDAQKTYENQLAMERLGVKPLPCFHYGEDDRYLEWYVSNYSYITIGGMVMTSTAQLVHWLDRIWERYMCDGSGRPKLKVHGFGITTASIMKRYPWYSVDSSSWVQMSNVGNILHPDFGNIAVSKDSPSLKEHNRHLDNMNPLHRAALVKAITDLGFDLGRLRESTYARRAFNFWGYRELNRQVDEVQLTQFTRAQPGLF